MSNRCNLICHTSVILIFNNLNSKENGTVYFNFQA